MKIQNGRPYAFIIGSSNLTSAAFDYNSRWSYTNFECDIVVYPNEYTGIFDKGKYEPGTFLNARSMNLDDVERLAQTFVKDFLATGILHKNNEDIFAPDYLNEVAQSEYNSDMSTD